MALVIPIPPNELTRIPDLLGFGPDEIAGRVRRLAHMARTEVVRLAKRHLHTSEAEYVRGIQPVEFRVTGNRATGVIFLRGTFPNMVEDGADPWNLRKTLLKPGGKVRRSAKGHLYRSIPFRHMGPDAGGKNAPPVGQAYAAEGQRDTSRAFRGRLSAAEARTMGRAVWRRAQKLEASKGTPGGGVQPGGRLDVSDIAGANEPLRRRHAAPLYAGMVRQQKTYRRATQSQFVTFRTISNNPATMRYDTQTQFKGYNVMGNTASVNWMHPGIEARGLFAKADTYVQRIAGAILLGSA